MNSYKLKYEGLNFSSFLNFLLKNNISIYKIKKVGAREYTFFMSPKNYNAYKKLGSIYNLQIVKPGGLKYFKDLVLRKIGLAVGLVIILVYMIIVNNRILYIKVTGNNYVDSSEIINLLQNYGIKTGSNNKINNSEIEQYLLDNNDKLNMASIKLQGNTLIVNVSEKPQDNFSFEPLYSPYNMVITKIELISGTAVVGSDSVVTKGMVLVEPYVVNGDGVRTECEARAVIEADVWFCGTEVEEKQKIVEEKTGRKQVFKNMFFNNKSVDAKSIVPKFDSFVTESRTYSVSNNVFLPIFVTETIFYETSKNIVDFDLNANKENFLEKSKQKAYEFVPKNVTIIEERNDIIELDNKYIFQTYLKAHMEITNEN